MRRTVLLITTALATAAAASPAAAAEFRPLEARVEQLLTDGQRFAVAVRPGGSLAVFDDEGPAPGLAPPCASGTLLAIGGGQAVFECPRAAGGAINVRMVDLVTRAERAPAGLAELDRQAEAGARPFGVGRHWLAVAMQGHRGSYTRFLNWRTGAVREDQVADDRRRVRPDLDHPELDRRLCAPLRRRFATQEIFFGAGETTVWADAAYGSRRMVIGPRVYRCGSRRTRVLSAADEFTVRLAPGRLLWREGAELVVEPLRKRARRVRIALPGGIGSLAFTGWRIFFVEGEGARAVHVVKGPR